MCINLKNPLDWCFLNFPLKSNTTNNIASNVARYRNCKKIKNLKLKQNIWFGLELPCLKKIVCLKSLLWFYFKSNGMLIYDLFKTWRYWTIMLISCIWATVHTLEGFKHTFNVFRTLMWEDSYYKEVWID